MYCCPRPRKTGRGAKSQCPALSQSHSYLLWGPLSFGFSEITDTHTHTTQISTSLFCLAASPRKRVKTLAATLRCSETNTPVQGLSRNGLYREHGRTGRNELNDRRRCCCCFIRAIIRTAGLSFRPPGRPPKGVWAEFQEVCFPPDLDNGVYRAVWLRLSTCSDRKPRQ